MLIDFAVQLTLYRFVDPSFIVVGDNLLGRNVRVPRDNLIAESLVNVPISSVLRQVVTIEVLLVG